MKFSFNWLQDYLKIDLSPEKLAELLTLHSFETEVVKKTKEDVILDIDILPNRFADASSHFGLAREIHALMKVIYDKEIKINPPKKATKKTTKGSLKIEIKEPTLCSRYGAALIKNVKIGPSPQWLKDKLAVCGVGSINNIVDITNFVMLELGQPIHAFDFDKIKGGIVVRKAKRKEIIKTIDGNNYNLNENILVIADEERPLALAGIKGGKEAELEKGTKNILIEAAHFERRQTYLASKQLGLESDAARRFSAGLDEELIPEALMRAIYLLEKEADGTLSDWRDINLCEESKRKIKINLDKFEKLIGEKFSFEKIKGYLTALNCQIQKISEKEIRVTVPAYRKDLAIKEDLVEEVARLYGYDNLEAKLPYLPLAPVKPQMEEIFQGQIRMTLKGSGYSEVYNYSFLSESLLKELSGNKEKRAYLKNPISERFEILRPNLCIPLLLNIKDGLKHDSDIRLFEIGKVFERTSDKVVLERNYLGLILSLQDRDALFELKGIVELILKSLGLSNFWFEERDRKQDQFCKQPTAIIKAGDDEIGGLGNFPKKSLDRLSIKQGCIGAYLDLGLVFKFAKAEQEYQPPSKYPVVLRDLALLVDKKIRFSEILNVIESLNADCLQDVDLFDVYEGNKLPRGKKSLAFHISYQSKEKTLSDKEVNLIHKQIEKALENELGAVIR